MGLFDMFKKKENTVKNENNTKNEFIPQTIKRIISIYESKGE